MAVIFMDESGLNPLPPGIFATIATPDGTVVGSGYIRYGGALNVTVQGAVQYVAVFSGEQAPTVNAPFSGSPLGTTTTVTVLGYRAPSLTQAGYASLLFDFYTRNWLGSTTRNPGSNAFALFSSLAEAPSTLDAQASALQGAMRAYTAIGADLDSWAADFFGTALPRYAQEDDPTYLSRILAAFGPRCTLAAIQQIVVQFYAATLAARIAASQENLAFDTAGGYDTRGGYDTYVIAQTAAALSPSVAVWDAASRPDLASQYSISAPQFVIAVAFSDQAAGWFLDYSALDISTTLIDSGTASFSSSPPDARLAPLVNLVKAGGTTPVYMTSINA